MDFDFIFEMVTNSMQIYGESSLVVNSFIE